MGARNYCTGRKPRRRLRLLATRYLLPATYNVVLTLLYSWSIAFYLLLATCPLPLFTILRAIGHQEDFFAMRTASGCICNCYTPHRGSEACRMPCLCMETGIAKSPARFPKAHTRRRPSNSHFAFVVACSQSGWRGCTCSTGADKYSPHPLPCCLDLSA